MTPQEFLAHVLPSEGYYCLGAKNEKSKGVRHLTYTDLNTMIHDAVDLNHGNEIYFSISTLAERSVLNTSTGKQQTRIGANCLKTKSLILDVDVRADKPGHHVDFKEALVEIAALSTKLDLCIPTIVHTGGGFHVYWTASEALDAETFAEKSSHFKQFVLSSFPKLAADPTRIGDRTSLLRIPGTANLKRAKDIRIIKVGTSFDVEKIKSWTPVPTSTKKLNGYHHPAVPVGVNLFSKSPPVKLDNVVKDCPQLKEMADTGGANCQEPLWYAMLGVVKHGEDSNTWAHKLSERHLGYTVAETDTKLNQATSTNTGPTTCRYFDNLRPSVCAGCKFKGKITSPIQLASGVVSAVVAAAPQIVYVPPSPYKRRSGGGITAKGKSGKPELVYDYDIYPIKKLMDEGSHEWSVKYRFFQPKDGWREAAANLSDFSDKQSALKVLMKGGVVPSFSQGAKNHNIGKYMVDCIRHLEIHEGMSHMYQQFGWREDFSSFVVGNRMYAPGGIVSEIELAKSTKELASKFQMKGTVQKWADIFDTYNKPGLEAYAFGALLAFASPLYKLTGHNGVIYNMVGESGSGKSTVLKLISSVWMKPDEKMLKKSDTVNSAEVILGIMHNLPVMFDEITNIHNDDLSDLCYNITQGRGRNRLHSTAALKSNYATWSLILCSTSNTSLIDKLGQFKSDSSAEAFRIFEIRVDKNAVIDKRAVDAAFRRIENNYGMAGDIYAKYIVDNKDLILTQLEEATTSIDADLNIMSPERFWSALLACVMVGGEIAKNLGLHRYDMDILYKWAANHMDKMRATVVEKVPDPLSILGNFMQGKVFNTVIFIQGKMRDTLMPHTRSQTQIRLEIDNGLAIAYVEVKALTDYCKENNVSISGWAEKLKTAKILQDTSKQKRLSAGCSDMPSVNVKCWMLNLAGQGFKDDVMKIIHAQQEIAK